MADEWLTLLTMAFEVSLRSMIPKVQFQSMQANCCYLDHFWSNFPLTGYLQGSTSTSIFCENEQFHAMFCTLQVATGKVKL